MTGSFMIMQCQVKCALQAKENTKGIGIRGFKTSQVWL
jgi:hypothetical protein